MFFSEEKRAFDPAMQEMLNKATIEVNKDTNNNNCNENYSVKSIQILVTTGKSEKGSVS